VELNVYVNDINQRDQFGFALDGLRVSRVVWTLLVNFNSDQLAVQPGHDVARRTGRREHAVPQRHREALDAGLDSRRYLGKMRNALLGQHRKGPHLSGPDLRYRGRDRHDHLVHFAAHHRRHRLCDPLVRYVHEVDFFEVFQKRVREMIKTFLERARVKLEAEPELESEGMLDSPA